MSTSATRWESRIVATGEERPEALRANPANWRRHPDTQRAALGEMLDEVGWVAQVIVNRTTGNLVDGHLRVDLAAQRGEESVPVLYVELTEDEERLVLAALDPIGALAVTDVDALRELIDGLGIEGELETLLTELAPPPAPEEPVAGYLEAMSVSLGDPRHTLAAGEVWRVGTGLLAVVSIYDGWNVYGPLLTGKRLLVPYPSPIVPLTERARKTELVMVQPDPWLAGHLVDKYAEVYGEGEVGRVD
jgi:hypothetical protein